MKKRETSVSVVDLHNSVKRLAISSSTAQEPIPGGNAHIVHPSDNMKSKHMNNSIPLNTVLSVANDINFESKYELQQEIGRGGFSVVYKCKERSTGVIFACKVSIVYIL